MCKKYYRGFAVLLVLLLVFSLPAALPSWWPGAKKTAPPAESVVVQEQTESQMQLIAELEAELTALKQIIGNSQTTLNNSKATIAKQSTELTALKQIIGNSQTTLNNSKATIAKQSTELTALKTLYDASVASQAQIKNDYDALYVAYGEMVKERDLYYSQVAKQSDWGGTVGAGAVFNPSTGKVGAELSMGVSFRDWTLEVGAGYSPDAWVLAVPDFASMDYRVGLKYRY
jgi:hypothetical protein